MKLGLLKVIAIAKIFAYLLVLLKCATGFFLSCFYKTLSLFSCSKEFEIFFFYILNAQ